VIIFITYGLEKVWLLKHESSKLIIYEKINLIKEENYEELLKDLQERTGIKKINRVEVGKINFLRDICDLTIYYYSNKMNEGHASDQKQKTDNDGDDD
jgi:GTPase involved in cell partitioning and DNA repair